MFLFILLKKFLRRASPTGKALLQFCVVWHAVPVYDLCASRIATCARDIVPSLGAQFLLWYACTCNYQPYDFWVKRGQKLCFVLLLKQPVDEFQYKPPIIHPEYFPYSLCSQQGIRGKRKEKKKNLLANRQTQVVLLFSRDYIPTIP